MKICSRVIIIGCGQIGASIGLNLVARKLADRVIGIDTNKENLSQALKRRAVDKIFPLKKAPDLFKLKLSEQDLMILSTPVLTIQKYLEILPRGPLLMDVGSTKRHSVAIAKKRRLRFVGAHPMAGTEKEGAEAANKDLFRGHVCLITPVNGVKRSDEKTIRQIWEKMGSRVFSLDSALHDTLLAFISHLPHLVAFSLMEVAGRKIPLKEIARYLGGGFRDTTRIAASSAEMWADIFLDNPKILEATDRFRETLSRFQSMIRKKKRGGLRKRLQEISWMRKKLDVSANRSTR
ncbi:MAG: prephenate dehydrogenase [Deltaproteobacteria bacterium]|nr:prephenate dehydrogenase [Deltaproteobacteria bacterium]